MKRIVALLLVAFMSSQAPTAWGQAETQPPQRSGAADMAINVGHVFVTSTYVPVKALLCALTLGASPLLYLSSGPRAPRETGTRACGGTWIITPEILKGEKPFEFLQDTPCCGYPDDSQ
jgi:hypothetical protein